MIIKVQRDWELVRAELKAALESYVGSPSDLAKLAKIDYFSARRYLSHAPENQTESAKRLCSYFNIDLFMQSASLQLVLDAVSAVWDGSEEHAKSLAGIVKWSQTVKNVGNNNIN